MPLSFRPTARRPRPVSLAQRLVRARPPRPPVGPTISGYHGAGLGGPGGDYQPVPRAPQSPGAAPPAVRPPVPPAPNPYDYEGDPILQRTRALGKLQVGDAEAEAIRLRKQLAIDYGDEDLATSLGPEALAAARANPHSLAAKLARDRLEQPRQLDESLDPSAFYSGHRITRQADLTRDLGERQTIMGRDLRERLGSIEQAVLAARRGALGEEIGAEEDAAGRLRDRLGDLPLAAGPGALGPAQRAARRVGPGAGSLAGRVARRIKPPPRLARRGIRY